MEREDILCFLQNKILMGRKALFEITEAFDDLNELFTVSESELYGLTEETDFGTIDRILRNRSEESVSENLEELKKAGISYVSFMNDFYPEKLREINDMPFGLFYKGRLPNPQKKTVAIIGSRRCSEYGKEVAYTLGKELTLAGCEVLSGMALGIDGYSHRGALYCGDTFAVLAGGVDMCYPRENIDIYDMISRGKGGIISEYPKGSPSLPRNFSMRNRIISGLSDVVIVVEASEKSGTSITVNYAIEQNREVFAVPGRIGERMSLGSNELIKNGAQILLSTEDVLQYLGMDLKGCTPVKRSVKLDKSEEIIYSYIKNGRTDMETLLERSALPVGELNEILIRLEIKGIIRKTDMSGYAPV